MAERIRELKPGEYHVPEAGKVLGVGSSALIGGVVWTEIVSPGSGGWYLDTMRVAVGAAGGFGAIMGLLIVLEERARARRVSSEGKK